MRSSRGLPGAINARSLRMTPQHADPSRQRTGSGRDNLTRFPLTVKESCTRFLPTRAAGAARHFGEPGASEGCLPAAPLTRPGIWFVMAWKRSKRDKLADWHMARSCAMRGDFRGWAEAHLRSRIRYLGMRHVVPDDVDCELLYRIYEQCPLGYEVDHIIPLNKGEHRPENLQYLLPSVNSKKARKTVMSYKPGDRLRWQDIVR